MKDGSETRKVYLLSFLHRVTRLQKKASTGVIASAKTSQGRKKKPSRYFIKRLQFLPRPGPRGRRSYLPRTVKKEKSKTWPEVLRISSCSSWHSVCSTPYTCLLTMSQPNVVYDKVTSSTTPINRGLLRPGRSRSAQPGVVSRRSASVLFSGTPGLRNGGLALATRRKRPSSVEGQYRTLQVPSCTTWTGEKVTKPDPSGVLWLNYFEIC